MCEWSHLATKKFYEARGRFEQLCAAPPQQARFARLFTPEEICKRFYALTTGTKPRVTHCIRETTIFRVDVPTRPARSRALGAFLQTNRTRVSFGFTFRNPHDAFTRRAEKHARALTHEGQR